MPWVRAILKGQAVFARADAGGKLKASGGKVEIRYKKNDGRKYEARAQNLEVVDAAPLPDDTCGPAEPVKRPGSPRPRTDKRAAFEPPSLPKDAVVIYTDGACSGNPGPAGLGVVVIDGPRRVEISEYLGVGTNNIAELTAVQRGLEEAGDAARPVVLHTDSRYAIGVVQGGQTAKANVALVEKVRRALSARPTAQLVYVPGHAGIPMNERADALAREAIQARKSRRAVTREGPGEPGEESHVGAAR